MNMPVENPLNDSRLTRKAILTAASVNTVCGLPASLLGALLIEMSVDLGIGLVQVGVAVGLFRGVGVLSITAMGTLSDRLGATQSLRIAVLVSGGASLGLGLLARSYGSLMAFLVVGALAKSLAQPAANRLLVKRVDQRKRGIAFGLKQSAAPAATMLAGLSVPLVALTVSWRAAYIIVGVLGCLAYISIRPHQSNRTRPNPKAAEASGAGPLAAKSIVAFAFAFGLSTFASSAVSTFFVATAINAGISGNTAGLFLALAGASAIIVRLATGIAADRMMSGHGTLCASLLLLGAFGVVLLALQTPASVATGGILALAGTWGFNAVFWYVVLGHFPQEPGRVTGLIMPGGLIGGIFGPVIVGTLAEAGDFYLAWSVTGVIALLASASMYIVTASLTPRPS